MLLIAVDYRLTTFFINVIPSDLVTSTAVTLLEHCCFAQPTSRLAIRVSVVGSRSSILRSSVQNTNYVINYEIKML